jgi:hypothetical protein
MTGVYVLLGGIAFFAGLITLLDGIAYRRRKRARKSHASGS